MAFLTLKSISQKGQQSGLVTAGVRVKANDFLLDHSKEYKKDKEAEKIHSFSKSWCTRSSSMCGGKGSSCGGQLWSRELAQSGRSLVVVGRYVDTDVVIFIPFISYGCVSDASKTEFINGILQCMKAKNIYLGNVICWMTDKGLSHMGRLCKKGMLQCCLGKQTPSLELGEAGLNTG